MISEPAAMPLEDGLAGDRSADRPTSYFVANVVVDAILGAAKSGDNDTKDPDAAIDGILMALASVLEQAPEFPTNQSLRMGADALGKRIHAHARKFREVYERTGVHPINALARSETLSNPVAH